jgi:glucan phosphoethanolaminetransferase (alkaline phosphatase superfamily)
MAFDLTAILLSVKPLTDFVFGSGKIVFARLFIASVLVFILYKVAIKLFKSPTISFIIALVVSILGLRMAPESTLLLLMNGYFALMIVGFFILITIFIRTTWWIRKTLLFVMTLVFAVLWYFYGKNVFFLISALLCLIFLAIDSTLHNYLSKLRKGEDKAKELDAEIKIEEKKMTDLISAGANDNELKSQRKKIDDLIKARSSL